MTRIITLYLIAVLLILLGLFIYKNENIVLESQTPLFELVCGADEGLLVAKAGDVVVFENGKVASGKNIWNGFYDKVEYGIRATVICANYYTLDRTNVDDEYYEAEKENYPKLFFSLIEYDGTRFKISTRQSTEAYAESTATYAHLVHYTGRLPEQSNYSSYEYYVLVDDENLTWDEIMSGLFSAQFDCSKNIRHSLVYSDYF